MGRDAREKWDGRWAGVTRIGDPAPFLVEIEPLFPRAGAVLDVASGPGRHGLWLAGLGHEVTIADVSPVALDHARDEARRRDAVVATIERDLERDGIPDGPWDAIVIHYYLDWRLLRAVPEALAPGGVVAFCQPTARDLEHGGTMDERYLLGDGEIASIAADWGLDVLVLEEVRSRSGRYEARIVARRAA